MSSLEEYKNKVKKYREEHPDLSENEIIRYVYMDLGERLSFNLKYAFGNKKAKKRIYDTGNNMNKLEEVLETNIGTCKEIAYIFEYIFKDTDIDVKAIMNDKNDLTPFHHFANLVTPKEGERYIIDLQDDLKNIKAHAFTTKFGMSPKDSKELIFSRKEIENMDRKLGFVSNDHYYSDEYMYLLKLNMSYFEDFAERVGFVLENIDAYPRKDIEYAERKLYHEKLLKELFSKDELKKIHFADCYEEDENKERKYRNCVYMQAKGKTDIYMYSNEETKYNKLSIQEFAKEVREGLVNLQGIPGLKKALNELNQKEDER